MRIAGFFRDGRARIAKISITFDAVISRPRSQRILNPDAATMATSKRAEVRYFTLTNEARIKTHGFRFRSRNPRTCTVVEHELARMCIFRAKQRHFSTLPTTWARSASMAAFAVASRASASFALASSSRSASETASEREKSALAAASADSRIFASSALA